MALGTGIVKLQHNMTLKWVNIGRQNTPQTAKSSITFDFSKLQNVNSNADKNKLRAGFVGMAIVRYVDADLAPDIGNGDKYTAQVERDSFFTVNVSQPNLSTKYMQQSQNLALVGQAALNINPAFCSLVDNLPPKQGIRQTVSPGAFGANYPNAQGDMSLANDRIASTYGTESWNDLLNFAAVSSFGGKNSTFVDATMIPACQYSGNSSHGTWIEKDQLPFPLLTNNSTPWTVTIQCENAVADQFNSATINTDVMEVWALVAFRKKSDTIRIGVLWSISNTPIGPGNYNPNPLFYRVIASVPTFNDYTNVVDGITLPYVPVNHYAFASTTQIKLNDDNVQVFPLDSYSDYQSVIDHYNAGSLLGGNPKLRYDYWGVVTSTVTSLSAFDPQYIGEISSMPWLPLAVNHLFMSGFPCGFMSDPQTASTRLNITYTGTLSATSMANVISIHVNQFYDDDMPKIMSYGLYGDSNQPAGSRLPAAIPLVDNYGMKVSLIRKIVPLECAP
jgi:hypothetical protein